MSHPRLAWVAVHPDNGFRHLNVTPKMVCVLNLGKRKATTDAGPMPLACPRRPAFANIRYVCLRATRHAILSSMSLSRFVRAVGWAVHGLKDTFLTQQNFRIQLVLGAFAVVLGILLRISFVDWSILALAIGAVLACELFNTGLEKLADYTSNSELHPLVKKAKDASAAAVLAVSLAALAIGILLLVVPLIHRLSYWLSG